MKVSARFSSFLFVLAMALFSAPLVGQDQEHDHSDHSHGTESAEHNHDHDHDHGCGGAHHDDDKYDPAKMITGHIADANEFHLWGEVAIPLPVILYAPGVGLKMGLSSMFHHGHDAVDGYVLNHGRVNRVAQAGFPMEGVVGVGGVTSETVDGAEKYFVCYNNEKYLLDEPSTLDGGMMGGGISSFYDFSITKNVFTMLLAALLLIFIWRAVAQGYQRNEGQAPSGIQSFMEPFFVFIRDEVTKPMIGEAKYERFQPFIMTLFFFILFCNLLGLVPFFPGSANVTGNIAVTFVLALLAFLVTNLNGNGHYWEHIFWMPGIPAWVKTILTPVEVLGLIIKPFSLMVRLFANISAGHIIILSLIGLIFLFGDSGASVSGSITGIIVGGAFTAFMNLIEFLVAFLQAFVFAILTASYIGAAVEEHEHHDHEH
ncbi:MAG: F0F1 ATP synthase subunit A, partial [Bacteroidota bacterium]